MVKLSWVGEIVGVVRTAPTNITLTYYGKLHMHFILNRQVPSPLRGPPWAG